MLSRPKCNTRNNGKSDGKSPTNSDSSCLASLWARVSPLGKSGKSGGTGKSGTPSSSTGMPDEVVEEVVAKKAKCKAKNNKTPDSEPKQGNNA